jgi:hypothetical protein
MAVDKILKERECCTCYSGSISAHIFTFKRLTALGTTRQTGEASSTCRPPPLGAREPVVIDAHLFTGFRRGDPASFGSADVTEEVQERIGLTGRSRRSPFRSS